MGGKGSGRIPDAVNPKKRLQVARDPTAPLIEATGVATAVAQAMPTAKERDAARKREERAKAKTDGSSARKKYPKPEEFRDHPLAKALNEFADKAAGVPGSGAAASSLLGEAWMSVIDYYFVGPDHPMIIATIATAQFGAVAWSVKSQQKRKTTPPNAAGSVQDAICWQCAKTFPSQDLVQAHVLEAHK